MIRIKILYDYRCYANNQREYAFYENKYSFVKLVNTYNFLHNDEEPFRDDESMMFIKEIDNAKFSSKYGVVTPYGECPVTSLCGGTQYALTVIHNSRLGRYTSYEPYGNDIWDRLGNLPFDILIFINLSMFNGTHISINKFIIENYKDDKGDISEKLIDNPQDCFLAFHNLSFNLNRDFENVVVDYAKTITADCRIIEFPPLIYNDFNEFGNFIDGVDDDNAEDNQPSSKYSDMKIHCYLTEMISTDAKYPIAITIERCQETKTYSVKELYPLKYPSFAELTMLLGNYDDNNEHTTVLDNFGNWNEMILIFDCEDTDNSKSWLNNICLGEKLEGKTISLYNGKRIWHELLKFIDGYKYQLKI